MIRLGLITCFITLSLSAAADNMHAIDMETQSCMEQNPSTMGMSECNHAAYKSWDTELNRVYRKLKNRLGSEAAKVALKKSQRNWIKYRDSELKFIEQMYQAEQGTYWVTIAGDMKTSLVKRRVNELEMYLDSLSPEM